MAGDTEREGGCPCQARGALNSGMLTVGYQWMSGRVRCLGRKFRGRILDYINATPFAGQRVLVVGMEIQGRKSLSTVSMARRRRYQYAAGFISSRAISDCRNHAVSGLASNPTRCLIRCRHISKFPRWGRREERAVPGLPMFIRCHSRFRISRIELVYSLPPHIYKCIGS